MLDVDAAPLLDTDEALASQKAMNRVAVGRPGWRTWAGSATERALQDARLVEAEARRPREVHGARRTTLGTRDAVADAARRRVYGFEEGSKPEGREAPRSTTAARPAPGRRKAETAPLLGRLSLTAWFHLSNSAREFTPSAATAPPPPRPTARRSPRCIGGRRCFRPASVESRRPAPAAARRRPRTPGSSSSSDRDGVRRRLHAATQGARGSDWRFGQARRRRSRRPRACGSVFGGGAPPTPATARRPQRPRRHRRPRRRRRPPGSPRSPPGPRAPRQSARFVPCGAPFFLRADPGDRPLRASDEGRGFRGIEASGSGETASTTEGGGGGSFVGFGSGGFNLSCAAATQLVVSLRLRQERLAVRRVEAVHRLLERPVAVGRRPPRRHAAPDDDDARPFCGGALHELGHVYAFGLPLLGFASCCPGSGRATARGELETSRMESCEALPGAALVSLAGSRATKNSKTRAEDQNRAAARTSVVPCLPLDRCVVDRCVHTSPRHLNLGLAPAPFGEPLDTTT